MQHRYSKAARVAALALLWGSGFLWIKVALESFTPIQVSTLRMVLGAAALLIILHWRRLSLPAGWATWGHLTIAALFGNAIPYLLFGIAEQEISSSAAGVITASTPLWTALLTVIAYRNAQAAQRNGWSLVLGFLGVTLIFSPWLHGSEIASWYGLACLMAAASYGVSYLYIGHFLARRKLRALPMATGQLISASALTALAIPFFGWPAPTWNPTAAAALVILGVLGTGVAYILNWRIITDDGPTPASIVQYLLPVVAVALGFTFLREPLQLQIIIGMVIVLIAAKLRRPESSTPRE